MAQQRSRRPRNTNTRPGRSSSPTQPPSLTGRTFHDPRPPAGTTGNGGLTITRPVVPPHRQAFRPLPPPTMNPPYHLSLDRVLTPEQLAPITAAGKLVFHIMGDVGGIKQPQPQAIVAWHMENDISTAAPASRPAFLYLLGDIIYYNGESTEYYAQFYEPYQFHPSPIFAIPGNHDGDTINEPSLAAFVENFCAPVPQHTALARDVSRETMTQPNVYWTLEAPFVTIVGLYTNVPAGGQLDNDQLTWLETELHNAPPDKALLLTMHHPPISADNHHSGSAYMMQVLDDAFQRSGRVPDAVLAGHVHNYQRFTRKHDGRDVPYIVAGAGGYWNLHYVSPDKANPVPTPQPTQDPNVTLESYCDDRHGYLQLEVLGQTLSGGYFAVPRPQEPWRNPPDKTDSFTLNLRQHQLST